MAGDDLKKLERGEHKAEVPSDEESDDEEFLGENESEAEEDDEEESAPRVKRPKKDIASSSSARPKAEESEEEDNDVEEEVVEDLSGDEVDPGLILPNRRQGGGRRIGKTGGASGSGLPRYTAEPQLGSDEDDW